MAEITASMVKDLREKTGAGKAFPYHSLEEMIRRGLGVFPARFVRRSIHFPVKEFHGIETAECVDSGEQMAVGVDPQPADRDVVQRGIIIEGEKRDGVLK